LQYGCHVLLDVKFIQKPDAVEKDTASLLRRLKAKPLNDRELERMQSGEHDGLEEKKTDTPVFSVVQDGVSECPVVQHRHKWVHTE
jgi:hypothetical protein